MVLVAIKDEEISSLDVLVAVGKANDFFVVFSSRVMDGISLLDVEPNFVLFRVDALYFSMPKR